jgi:hypothetical protein
MPKPSVRLLFAKSVLFCSDRKVLSSDSHAPYWFFEESVALGKRKTRGWLSRSESATGISRVSDTGRFVFHTISQGLPQAVCR